MPFDDNAILGRTLPEEDADPTEFQKLLQRARTSGGKLVTPPLVEPATPPEDSTWDKEFQKQKQRYMGLDQKYNPDGSPRKKSVMEKILAGVNTLGTAISPGSYANIRQRTKDSLETGERTRIAKIAADQRRDAVKEQEETKRTKNAADAWYKTQVAEINRLVGEGKISYQESLSAKAQAQADRERGISEGTSAEGKSLVGLRGSQADLNKAKAAGTLSREDQFNKAMMEGGWKAHIQGLRNRMLATGSQTINETNEVGDVVNKGTRRIFGNSGAPLPPAPTNPYQRTGPLPGGAGRDEALSVPNQAPRPEGLQDPGFSVPPPTNAPIVPPRVAKTLEGGRNNSLGGNLTWEARGANPDSTMLPKEFATKLKGTNALIRTVNGLANQTANAYVDGDLSKFSGAYGTPLVTAVRQVFGEVDPAEAVNMQMGTRLFGIGETSDFGNRVLAIQAKAESGSLPPKYMNEAGKVATYLGQAYSRTVGAWAEAGTPEQRELAKEILSGTSKDGKVYGARMGEVTKSIGNYIAYLTSLKQAKEQGRQVGPTPPLTPNLFILSRTDDELRKLFPAAKTPGQLKMIRIFGGTGGNAQKLSDKPATPAVDNRKLLDKL